MAVRLRSEEVLTSSTLRELLGVKRLDLALVPLTCKKLIVLLDSMAAVHCLLNGSKVTAIQTIVRDIFLNQLRHNRVLWPMWMRRDTQVIRICDDMSRWVDRHAYVTTPAIFWMANKMAKQIWGCGFQLDTCADMHNAQPIDRQWRLPFFSRWPSPHTSGVDMLQQSWRRKVCWCNPPFPLLPRVTALMRAQRASGAVIAPARGEITRLAGLQRGAQGVVCAFDFNLDGARDRRLTVFFLDFRPSQHPPSFHDCISAGDIPGLQNKKAIRYLRLSPTSM